MSNELTEEQVLTELGIIEAGVSADEFLEKNDLIDASGGSLSLQFFWHMGAGDVDCRDIEHPIDNRLYNELREDESNAGRLRIYAKAAKAWEAETDIMYQKLKTLLNKGEQAKLQAAQTAWLAFRDDEMRFNAAYWSLFTDSAYATVSSRYGLDMIRFRAHDLWHCYDEESFIPDVFRDLWHTGLFDTEEEWEQMMNEKYQSLMSVLSEENRTKLQAAQTKWIAYHEADCIAYNACCKTEPDSDYRLLKVKERALRLEKYLDDTSKL
jgi:uncharacterized protein YecT (DUF1311 family)